jgi:hypothetical protein
LGELAVIKKKSKIQSKLNDKGIKVMFLGYARNHAGNNFLFLNLGTKKVVLSRDVIWLSQILGHDGTNNIPVNQEQINLSKLS